MDDLIPFPSDRHLYLSCNILHHTWRLFTLDEKKKEMWNLEIHGSTTTT